MATRKTGSKTGGTGGRTSGRKRHSPSTRKPATIDLEPNEVASKQSQGGSDKSVAPKTSGKAETSAGGGAAGAASTAAKPADTKSRGGTGADAKAATSAGPSATQEAAKTADATTADTKPEDAKPAASKPDATSGEGKPADPKSADTKLANTKPADTKPGAAKPADAKPSDPKGGSVPKVSADDGKSGASGLTPGRSGVSAAGGAAGAMAAGAGTSATRASDAKSADATSTAAKPADAKASTGAATKPADTAKPGDATKPADTTKASGADRSKDAERPTPAALAPPPKGAGGPTPPPRAAETSSGTSRVAGFGSLLAAGLVGGVVTLGGAWAFGAFGDDTATLRDETATLRSDLDRRITAVESAERPEAISQAQVDEAIRAALEAERASGAAPDEATAARLAELENQLATARASLATLEDEPAIPDTSEALDQARAVIAALETRVGELGQRLDAAENSGGQGLTLERATALTGEAVNPVREEVAGLAERVETLSTTLTERGRTLEETRTTLADVQSGLTQLREGQEALGTRLEERISAAATPLRERLDKLDATTNNLRTDLDAGLKAAEERSATLRTDLEGAVDGVRQGVADLDGKVTSTTNELRTAIDTARSELTARLDERAAATDERLKVIEADIADTGPEERAAAALALANLRTRLDAGEPYGTELELVRDTQAQADLEPLRPYASEGIATLPQLRESFDEAADAILAATRPETDGAVGGFAANLRDLVQVRRAGGSRDGDGPRAVIADIRGAMAEGDLAAADQAWRRLPTAGKNASSNWHGRLLARIQAGQILPAAVSRLIRDAG